MKDAKKVFAFSYTEETPISEVSGKYDEDQQVWVHNQSDASAGGTFTSTNTGSSTNSGTTTHSQPNDGDPDQDPDSDPDSDTDFDFC